MAEAVVFGRAAMGETVEQGAFTDRWRVRRGGRLIFAETVRLDGAIAQDARRARGRGGGVAIATVLAVPGDEAMAARVRAQTFCGEVGHLGLERDCGGAPLRQGWRGAAPRSRHGDGGAGRPRCRGSG